MREYTAELVSQMADQDYLVLQAIARRAFELHESAGSRHGRDHDDWYQAERELVVLDSQLRVEADGLSLMIQIPIEAENGTHILASISPRSILLLTVPDSSTVDGCGRFDLRDLVRVLSLPQEVIPEQVTTCLDEHGLRLRLPFLLGGPILQTGPVIDSATVPSGRKSQYPNAIESVWAHSPKREL